MGTSISRSTGNNTPIELATNVTFLEATTHITNSTLETGMFYLMTDFETIYDQPDYDDVYTPKAVVVTKTAAVDPILLLATSPNTFAKEVWRPSTPKHRLEYDFDFVLTEYMNTPAKGRITKCIDENNNETQYDHTVVLFKRYESVSGSGTYDSFWDTGFASVEVLTFGSDSFHNKIGPSDFIFSGGFFLGNNTFGSSAFLNILDSGTESNTFKNSAQFNTFGFSLKNNIFGNNLSSNNFGGAIQFNTFGGAIQFNTFGDAIQFNTFGDNTKNNTFGNYITTTDFTSATHIYQNYHCEIFKRQDGTDRLRYTDNTDALVVVAPTD